MNIIGNIGGIGDGGFGGGIEHGSIGIHGPSLRPQRNRRSNWRKAARRMRQWTASSCLVRATALSALV